MSTKMDRVVLFVEHLNDEESIEDVKYHFENMRYPEFVTVKDIKRTDIGEWDDNHELNKTDATLEQFEKYYPELQTADETELQKELQKERELRMKSEDEKDSLNREVSKLKRELEKFKGLDNILKEHYKG